MTATLDAQGYLPFTATIPDAQTLMTQALATIAANIPGWVPREGNLEVMLLEQFVAAAVETAQVEALIPPTIFSYFGGLLGIAPEAGASATAMTTWTMADTQGYTVPAGTQVGYAVLGNQFYLFQTVDGFTVSPGQQVIDNVEIISTNTGSLYNGLSPQILVLVTALNFVIEVQSTTLSAGGQDPETATAYLDRLSQELQLLSPRPILPRDFAILAQNIEGVFRAAAFDGLNPFANLLSLQDGTFANDAGSWTVVGAPTPTVGPGIVATQALNIVATGGTPVVATSGFYSFNANDDGLALFSLEANANETATLGVEFFDQNENPISTFTGPSTTLFTGSSNLTEVECSFTAPTGTSKVKLIATIITPGAGDLIDIAYPGLFFIDVTSSAVNYVPDSDLEQTAELPSWVVTGLDIVPYATGTNALEVFGTGAGSGNQTAKSNSFFLPPGTYELSAFIDSTNVTGGVSPYVSVINAGTGAPIVTVHQPTTDVGVVSSPFTQPALGVGVSGMVFVEFNTNNCTILNLQRLLFAEPQITQGSTVLPYTSSTAWSEPDLVENNERTITVAAVDASGDALPIATEVAVEDYLESLREVNFEVFVIGPTVTPINVTWGAIALPGADVSAVQVAGNNALAAYLSRATWGGGALDPPEWDPSANVVRILSIIGILAAVPGIDYLTSVSIGAVGGTLGRTDVPLNGFAPLADVPNPNVSGYGFIGEVAGAATM